MLQQVGLPNSYTLTKHMAEEMMAGMHCKAFPVAIVRPTIIGAVAKAPPAPVTLATLGASSLPTWDTHPVSASHGQRHVKSNMDSTMLATPLVLRTANHTNGCTHRHGALFAATIRTVSTDIIPCDLVASAVLAAAVALQQVRCFCRILHPMLLCSCMMTKEREFPTQTRDDACSHCPALPYGYPSAYVWQGGTAGAPGPLVLHSGSSCTNPISNNVFYQYMFKYWDSLPAPARCSTSAHPTARPS